ncbi:tetratricopeptide repeat protein [Streptomyces sp. NBC_01443]|uniref:tetratricopeptide repeat protein n=1 Tax=Streptomyces sp. NBC_01443 TaxID=2903868 RepID=UPI00224ECC94|nr:tetratricopeptide repeat protein [Streptomyces sp. NBC_01443]MCX4632779.1 tetratricopeptide repeat protein [Streptomyces sp. NBC_01443]
MTAAERPLPGAAPGAARVEQRAVASGFGRIFQATGDMVVYEGVEPYRLAPWPLSRHEGASIPKAAPSTLLQAGAATVNFAGRLAERAQARQWRDTEDALRLCLVHGPGGQGKTRLAMQIAAEWRVQGWTVLGAFHHRDRQAPSAFSVPGGLDQAAGVLVVVDYAERWDTEDLLTLLGDTSVGAGRGIRVRVLLLARPSGVWWQNISYRIERDFGIRAERLELPPVETDPMVSREGLFSAARDRFAKLLSIPEARAALPPAGLLGRDEYQLVLAVHMAALGAVLATCHGDDPPSEPAAVSAYLLARERDHWLSLRHRREDPLTVTPDAMGQLVYTATLTGPVGYSEGKQAILQAGVESAESPGAILKEHARCYPAVAQPGAAGTTPATVLEPLYPDRLGEDYIALLTHGHSHDFPSDLWADEAPARLLTLPDNASAAAETAGPVWTRRALTTLVEAASRWPHLAQTQVYPLLLARPALALQAGGAAVVALAAHPHIDPDVLEAIDALLPEERSEWTPAAAAVADRLLDRRLAAADDAGRARIRGSLANRLANVGQKERALTLSEEAFRAFHELAPQDIPAYLPEAAYAEGNFAVRLAQSGHLDEALARSNTTVLWLMILTGQDRDRFLPELARAHYNHAGWLADAGRHEEALSWSQDAVDELRELTLLPDGNLHLPSLQGLNAAVSRHAQLLAIMGRHEEALTLSDLSLVALRSLVRLDRARLLPELPASLRDHADLLEQTDRPLDALPHSEEAIEVLRELASHDQDAYRAPLAQELGRHALRLSELGRTAKALRVSEEAVLTRRELAAEDRDTHLPPLIAAVRLHLVLLEEADAPTSQFLRYSEESVALHREKARRECNPDSLADLVRALIPHASRLMKAGRFDEALAYSQEATAAADELKGGAADTVDLPIASGWHALWLEQAKRFGDVLPYSAEAIEIAYGRVQVDRDANLPDLAARVSDHASRLADAGQQDEALAHCRLAVEWFEELFEFDPDTHREGYVRNTAVFAHILIKGGRFAEAIIPLLFASNFVPQLLEEGRPIGPWLAELIRTAHAGAPKAVSRQYQQMTGQPIPSWLQSPPGK